MSHDWSQQPTLLTESKSYWAAQSLLDIIRSSSSPSCLVSWFYWCSDHIPLFITNYAFNIVAHLDSKYNFHSNWVHFCCCLTQNGFSTCTLSTGCLWSAVRRPGRLLPPPYARGSNNTQKVDGVRVQAFQKMFGLFSWQLYLCYCTLWTGAIGQAVAGNSTAAQFQWKRLPGHLDVCGASAGEAELRGPEGNWEPRRS